MFESIEKLQTNIESVFKGKSQTVKLAITCLLAGGHLLVEDIPGVGKTLLAQAIAISVGLSFSRIQFTSDLLPADILGVNIFDQKSGEFVLKKGAIFANVLLADEINRTAPRTQSALLEAMAEAHVSIDDKTYQLPDPFLVIATQNPLESHGTYPLPESQLDRFLMRIAVGYPARSVERELLLTRTREAPILHLKPVFGQQELRKLQEAVDSIHFEPSLVDYIMDIVVATRQTAQLMTGVSTRGALAIQRASKAFALVNHRDYVLPEDIKTMTISVLSHRVVFGGGETIVGSTRLAAEALIRELVDKIMVPA